MYRQGRSLANRHFVLYCFANPASERPRLGLSVSRKVGGAVQRNHVKRLLREAFAQVQDELVAHHDIVVVARPGSHELAERGGLAAVSASLNELIDRGRLRQTDAQGRFRNRWRRASRAASAQLGESGAQMHALAPAQSETASAGPQAGEPRLTVEETAAPVSAAVSPGMPSGPTASRAVRVARAFATAPIVLYQKLISPALPRRCKYEPTCSRYARGSDPLVRRGQGCGARGLAAAEMQPLELRRVRSSRRPATVQAGART